MIVLDDVQYNVVTGVCALSVDNDKNYIAYPGSSQNGEVQVFDAINLVCLKTMFVLRIVL